MILKAWLFHQGPNFPVFTVNALLTMMNAAFCSFSLYHHFKINCMKKIMLTAFLAGMVSLFSAAQTKEPAKPVHAVHKVEPSKTKTVTPTTKVKTKPETTVPQKVNNTVRPKHKKSKGTKTKTKTTN